MSTVKIPHGNPNHPVTRSLEPHWHKVCALVMFMAGTNEIEIGPDNIDDLEKAGLSIVADARNGRFVLRLVDKAEGDRLARQEGGLPV